MQWNFVQVESIIHTHFKAHASVVQLATTVLRLIRPPNLFVQKAHTVLEAKMLQPHVQLELMVQEKELLT